MPNKNRELRLKSSRASWKRWRERNPETVFLLRAYSHMKNRCLNPKDGSYPRYGGRGINVCEKWKRSFRAFVEDMGPRPTINHSLDRINNNGNYEPGNCRWATRQEQAGNKRNCLYVNVRGERMSLAEACRQLGLVYGKTLLRITRLGWPVQRALMGVSLNRIYVNCGQEKVCLREACRRSALNYNTVLARIRMGWSVERAITTPVRGPR